MSDIIINENEIKVCNECGSSNNKFGPRRKTCYICISKKNNERLAKNKYFKKYYEENKDKIKQKYEETKELKQKYYEENKDRIIEKQKQKRLLNENKKPRGRPKKIIVDTNI